MVKIPGEVAATGTVTVLELTPLFTTMVAVGPMVAKGTSTLSCPELTKRSGAGLLLISTLTPFSDAGYGGAAVWSLLASPVPYNVTNSPGEIGFPAGAELAALTTPSGFRKTPVPACAG